ncbi:MAG: response regulator [Rhodoferax sp.]|nr:response regulator [Rhodoferax sp.]
MTLPTVLIIDDQIQSVTVLLQYFRGQAINVMVALDGMDGITKARQGQVDIILLDVSMPGMSGYETCRALKSDPATRRIPVIFLSGNSSIDHKLEGFSCGGVDYISKPFNSEEVLARIFVHFKYGITNDLKLNKFYAIVLSRESTLNEVSKNNKILAMAIEIMASKNLQWEGTIKLAHQLGVNEKKLTDLFKNQFGMTVSEYYITQRLEIAREQLATTKTQIQVISTDAGYQNASDFSRAFRARYGLGPREYRQACDKENKNRMPGVQ